jgi:hypothetical protein
MLVYVVVSADEFVCNKGGVVQLPAPYIKMCVYFTLKFLNPSQHLYSKYYIDLLHWTWSWQVWYPQSKGVHLGTRRSLGTQKHLFWNHCVRLILIPFSTNFNDCLFLLSNCWGQGEVIKLFPDIISWPAFDSPQICTQHERHLFATSSRVPVSSFTMLT